MLDRRFRGVWIEGIGKGWIEIRYEFMKQLKNALKERAKQTTQDCSIFYISL